MLIYPIICGLFGACLGSFLNLVAYRLPLMLAQQWQQQARQILNYPPLPLPRYHLLSPRSHCQHCYHQLAWYDLMPIMSWLRLIGHCRYCGQFIGYQHPLIELLLAVLLLVYGYLAPTLWLYFVISSFSMLLILLFLLDWQHRLLPDTITLPLLWLGLLVNSYDLITPIEQALLGSVSAYLCFTWLGQLYYYYRQRVGLAGGDSKLLAALAAWLGWQTLPYLTLLSCCLALLHHLFTHRQQANTTIPFGCYLAISGHLLLFFRLCQY